MIAKDFTIFVRHKDTTSEPWAERYKKETPNPEKFARDLIDLFNSSLREGERPREVVRVEVHGDAAPTEHDWHKKNAVTVEFRGRTFDAMVCERCRITGKRYGLRGVQRDNKYQAEIYNRCDTAIKHLRKKKL